ncbi:MAG: 2-hydroxyglutaryl-CoA dehydratase [Pseudomonadales bacterium]|nr:2-hydroxyglutaryl-CoA dehydratase [Pseudomonadales bacterium]
MRGRGYKMIMMDVPDNDAFRTGKEFGNRGQCNPTYFTVGNLVKFLTHLRDEKGLSTESIIKDYVYLSAGACGPCRFGSYITEYRKALRDSGFEGFRIISASQTAGYSQTVGDGDGMIVTPSLFAGAITSLVVGDVLNALMYRIRPYEVNAGETDKVIEQCRQTIEAAYENHTSLFKAMFQVKKQLQIIEVDRSVVKPKVAIIGEFWAMTTEGDGNYKLQSFLESEGAEVDVQLITAWMLYLIWQAKYDTKKREQLKERDSARRGLAGVNIAKRHLQIWAADKALKIVFKTIALFMGLKGYTFPDMDEIAAVSQDFYNSDNRGGEGHMEVGKLILNAKKNKVNMTLSVKPFGCMPSSGVSDGVQSKITELYPEAIFLPIETTGDGAVNVYSRIQMQLFKAKQQAQKEFSQALQKSQLSREDLSTKLQKHKINSSLHHSSHLAACTAASTVYDVAR